MRIKLLNYTKDALELLLYTKNTRWSGSARSISSIKKWSYSEKEKQLAYMRDTVQSSWEFVDYVFEIKEVTRAFTHQLVRTRTASYAQQAQRIVDVRKEKWETPKHFINSQITIFNSAIQNSMKNYIHLIDQFAVSPQDARGLLPTNMHTNIITKMNLRTLSNLAELRLCVRTQKEYQDVVREMRKLVWIVHPWVEKFGFIEVFCVKYGTCCFPRYTECPFQKLTLGGEKLKEIQNNIRKAFYSQRYETNFSANKT